MAKRKAKKISPEEAYRLAKKIGIDFKKGPFEQSISGMAELAAIAKLAGYRKPKSASGSTGRYFFQYLKKKVK
tara:strand:+ start:239 stop:457 length:219 start_codon:yes stop_codon:yes gene_type:complete